MTQTSYQFSTIDYHQLRGHRREKRFTEDTFVISPVIEEYVRDDTESVIVSDTFL